MHDLIIRGGRVVDGSGAAARGADVAITDGRITEVGEVTGAARREIDADGLLVTPGFVDIHTHYDAQATWDPHLFPSGGHGVTTVVMGNCGVGFAPVRAGGPSAPWLIEPDGRRRGHSLGRPSHEGIRVGAVGDLPRVPRLPGALPQVRAIDVGAQIAARRRCAFYAMGERGAHQPGRHRRRHRATMGIASLREGHRRRRRLGFSDLTHDRAPRPSDGEPVPGTFAADEELIGHRASAMGEHRARGSSR